MNVPCKSIRLLSLCVRHYSKVRRGDRMGKSREKREWRREERVEKRREERVEKRREERVEKRREEKRGR
jgi:hypothetical protein